MSTCYLEPASSCTTIAFTDQQQVSSPCKNDIYSKRDFQIDHSTHPSQIPPSNCLNRPSYLFTGVKQHCQQHYYHTSIPPLYSELPYPGKVRNEGIITCCNFKKQIAKHHKQIKAKSLCTYFQCNPTPWGQTNH